MVCPCLRIALATQDRPPCQFSRLCSLVGAIGRVAGSTQTVFVSRSSRSRLQSLVYIRAAGFAVLRFSRRWLAAIAARAAVRLA